jgi:hypothetical protein
LREIGNWPLNNWGAVYPRTGWTIQHSEPKSSGIVAQRVGDIITRSAQPHIYLSILGDSMFIEDEKVTWSPDSLEENTNEEGWWEELDLDSDSDDSGSTDSTSESGSSSTDSTASSGSDDSGSSSSGFGQCLLFGENDTLSVTGWGGGRVDESGEYQYALWRPYTCCEVGTGVLIKVETSPYPVIVVTN